MADDTDTLSPAVLAAELTSAWLSNPNTRASAEDALAFYNTMRSAVDVKPAPAESEPSTENTFEPAVSARKSLATKDFIISMLDGKPYKALKRHLSTHGLTPDSYRERFNLKPDYPMVAENYASMRRDMAKKIGLGRKPGQKAPTKAKS